MKNKALEIIIGVFGGIVSTFYGTDPQVMGLLKILLLVMLLDIISGVITACYWKKLSSKSWHRGIFKKIGMLILVSVGYFINQLNVFNFINVESSIIFALAVGECLSCIENVNNLQKIKMPDILVKFLNENKYLQDEDKKKEYENTKQNNTNNDDNNNND